jgi:hypothetical protein
VIGFNAPQLVYKPMVEFFQRHWKLLRQVSRWSAFDSDFLSVMQSKLTTTYYLSTAYGLSGCSICPSTWVFVSSIMLVSGLFGPIFSLMYPVYLIYPWGLSSVLCSSCS